MASGCRIWIQDILAWRRKRKERKVPEGRRGPGGSKFIRNDPVLSWDQRTGRAGGMPRTVQKAGWRKKQASEGRKRLAGWG